MFYYKYHDYIFVLQEGETVVHYASELTKDQAHHEFEDTDIIKLMLEFDGDTNTPSRLVSIFTRGCKHIYFFPNY